MAQDDVSVAEETNAAKESFLESGRVAHDYDRSTLVAKTLS